MWSWNSSASSAARRRRQEDGHTGTDPLPYPPSIRRRHSEQQQAPATSTVAANTPRSVFGLGFWRDLFSGSSPPVAASETNADIESPPLSAAAMPSPAILASGPLGTTAREELPDIAATSVVPQHRSTMEWLDEYEREPPDFLPQPSPQFGLRFPQRSEGSSAVHSSLAERDALSSSTTSLSPAGMSQRLDGSGFGVSGSVASEMGERQTMTAMVVMSGSDGPTITLLFAGNSGSQLRGLAEYLNNLQGDSLLRQVLALAAPPAPKKHVDLQALEQSCPAQEWSGAPEHVCTVCMADVEHGEKYRSLGCGHKFHMECIDEWLSGESTGNSCDTDICPNCRAPVAVMDIEETKDEEMETELSSRVAEAGEAEGEAIPSSSSVSVEREHTFAESPSSVMEMQEWLI